MPTVSRHSNEQVALLMFARGPGSGDKHPARRPHATGQCPSSGWDGGLQQAADTQILAAADPVLAVCGHARCIHGLRIAAGTFPHCRRSPRRVGLADLPGRRGERILLPGLAAPAASTQIDTDQRLLLCDTHLRGVAGLAASRRDAHERSCDGCRVRGVWHLSCQSPGSRGGG